VSDRVCRTCAARKEYASGDDTSEICARTRCLGVRVSMSVCAVMRCAHLRVVRECARMRVQVHQSCGHRRSVAGIDGRLCTSVHRRNSYGVMLLCAEHTAARA
jgi:hypothetical protein